MVPRFFSSANSRIVIRGPMKRINCPQNTRYGLNKISSRSGAASNPNRAGAWLLAVLPGIGEVRAQAIVDYRLKNGPFLSIRELTRVEGIGTATYEDIKDLITVTD